MSTHHEAIERFLKASRQPYLLEPGEDLLPLKEGSFSSSEKIPCCDSGLERDANLSRRVIGLGEEREALELWWNISRAAWDACS